MLALHIGPWDWSLETVLLAVSVGVAFLGAVATVIVASLALNATRHAEREAARARELEASARARASRAELTRAVDAYLNVAPPFNRLPQPVAIKAHQNLSLVGSMVGGDGEKIPVWLHNQIQSQVIAAGTDENSREAIAIALPIEVRARMNKWTRGEPFDFSPLLQTTED